MTPYRVDVRRPDGWHTLTVRAASPEMATSYAYRSTHDALEARQTVAAELPPPKPGTHESDLPICGLPFGSVPGDTDANYGRAKHWSRENAPPPKPDMTIAWGITEALIEDRGQ